jgi:hypothetical protein
MTAEIHCVSKFTVSNICREAQKGKDTEKLFLSPRKNINIPNRAAKLNDF